MIVVKGPKEYCCERQYVLSVVFSDFLGLDFQLLTELRQTWCLSEKNDTSLKEIIIEDCFFQTSKANWLTDKSLPKKNLDVWCVNNLRLHANLCGQQLPIIYGKPLLNNYFFEQSREKIHLGLDIFGSIFFMLTRYEEKVKKTRDRFDRFPASASLAYQEGFLHRPIVNEYVEILWACLKKLWPGLERKPQKFQIRVSHDVDIPYQYAFTKVPVLARNVMGDVFKRRNVTQGLSRVKTWQQVQQGNLESDPFSTFDWIMTLSEAQNLTSAFYFITAHTSSKRDGNYSVRHPLMRNLLRTIHQRGHEIGLHPSFNTYLDAYQTCQEFEMLRQVCHEENIQQERYGGRQHFLRWQMPDTFQNWNDAGLSYDSTLTYADQAGFRCGTCYEYPVFNLLTRQTLKLIERPLIVMECTVLDERYMGLENNISQAHDYIVNLKQLCRLFNGTFTLLWHNHRFVSPIERELYQQILTA